MKNHVLSGLVVLLSLGCGAVVEQPLGDGPGGAAADDDVPQGRAGKSSSSSSSSGNHGSCADGCDAGYGCHDSEVDPIGICAPFCDDPYQAQSPGHDNPCSNSVRGGGGICVFSFGHGEIYDLPASDPGYDNNVQGLCSVVCDPVQQDCPAGYKCDSTNNYSAVDQIALFACLPNKTPLALGKDCDGGGQGLCDVGLTCSLAALPEDPNHTFGSCAKYCNFDDPHGCPAGQSCVTDVVTAQVDDTNDGVCIDADWAADPANVNVVRN